MSALRNKSEIFDRSIENGHGLSFQNQIQSLFVKIPLSFLVTCIFSQYRWPTRYALMVSPFLLGTHVTRASVSFLQPMR